jgi:hypothetical protein
MVTAIGVDVWLQIMDHLDMRSKIYLMRTCKYLHTNLEICSAIFTDFGRNSDLGYVTAQTKYNNIISLQIKTSFAYWISGRWTKLTSLNIECQISSGVNDITTLTALTIHASESLYQNNITLPNLRRLELLDDHFRKLNHLTALTYLKCKSICTDGFRQLPLLELDIENNMFDLSKMSRLTKLTLHKSSPAAFACIEKLWLIELALIECDSLTHGVLPDLNNMTTLTSLTKIDSFAATSKLYLRNLCICECHAHYLDRVQNYRHVTCKQISQQWRDVTFS